MTQTPKSDLHKSQLGLTFVYDRRGILLLRGPRIDSITA